MNTQDLIVRAKARGWRFYWNDEDNSLYGNHSFAGNERLATIHENCITDKNALGLILAHALNSMRAVGDPKPRSHHKSILKRR